jgi:hypothetical protein
MALVRNNSSVGIVIKLAGVPKVFPPGVYEYSDDLLKCNEFKKALEIYPCLSILPKSSSDTVTTNDKSLETTPIPSENDKLTIAVRNQRVMAKRGRPKFENFQGSLEAIRSLYPNIKTRRGLQNKFYELKALNAIKSMEGIEFLFDSKTDNFKSSILAEIGKTGDDELMRAVAAEICKRARTEKLTVKQWVSTYQRIKEVMLGRYSKEQDNLRSGFLNRQKKKHKTR